MEARPLKTTNISNQAPDPPIAACTHLFHLITCIAPCFPVVLLTSYNDLNYQVHRVPSCPLKRPYMNRQCSESSVLTMN